MPPHVQVPFASDAGGCLELCTGDSNAGRLVEYVGRLDCRTDAASFGLVLKGKGRSALSAKQTEHSGVGDRLSIDQRTIRIDVKPEKLRQFLRGPLGTDRGRMDHRGRLATVAFLALALASLDGYSACRFAELARGTSKTGSKVLAELVDNKIRLRCC